MSHLFIILTKFPFQFSPHFFYDYYYTVVIIFFFETFNPVLAFYNNNDTNEIWPLGGKYERITATYRAVSSALRKSNDPRQQVARRLRRCCRVSARRPKTLAFNIFLP